MCVGRTSKPTRLPWTETQHMCKLHAHYPYGIVRWTFGLSYSVVSLPYVWYHQQEDKFIGQYHMSRPMRKLVKSSQATDSPDKPGAPFRWCAYLRRWHAKLRASHISAYSEQCNLMNETGFSSLSTNEKAIANRSG